ncbi:hypothetical protein SpCBS45565_g07605 [Spizellomyces sp. 'palustris']|nr:hypothetical protein SpCBS45565_g07605 [Spizellomyces sp. 'palustris']
MALFRAAGPTLFDQEESTLCSRPRANVKVTYADRQLKRELPAAPIPETVLHCLDNVTEPSEEAVGDASDGKLPPLDGEERDVARNKKARLQGCQPITSYFAPPQRQKHSSPARLGPSLAREISTAVKEDENRQYVSQPDPTNGVKPKATITEKSNAPQRKGGLSKFTSAKPPIIKYEQLFLDLGQKDTGLVTCPDCGMAFSKAKAEDDALHQKYHRAVVNGVEWPGYKSETVACEFADKSQVIVVTNTSAKQLKSKAATIVSLVNNELGSISTDVPIGCKVGSDFFAIQGDHRLITEPVSSACRVMLASETIGDDGKEIAIQMNGSVTVRRDVTVEVLCGISRIWVLKSERRKGIASKLLDAVRAKFLFGCILDKGSIAFSQPTGAGKVLAERYYGRSDFLVYDG